MNATSSFFSIACILLLSNCDQEQRPETPTNTYPYVKVVQPRQEKVSFAVMASGAIGSDEEVTLSFKTGGVVARIFADEGDRITQGQLLAKLNTTELEAQLQQVDLSIEKCRRDVQRLQKLVKDTIATLEQLQNMQTTLESFTAQREGINYNLAQSSLYAPSAGIIVNKAVSVGEFKTPGNPVFIVAANSLDENWLFRAGLSDRDRMKLRPGDKATITLDAVQGRKFEGIISKLSSIPDPSIGTYDCYVSLPADADVVYGLSGKLTVEATTPALYSILPMEVLVGADRDRALLYVVKDSVAERMQVEIAFIQADEVALKTVLPSDLQVITVGKNKVDIGKKVKVIE